MPPPNRPRLGGEVHTAFFIITSVHRCQSVAILHHDYMICLLLTGVRLHPSFGYDEAFGGFQKLRGLTSRWSRGAAARLKQFRRSVVNLHLQIDFVLQTFIL